VGDVLQGAAADCNSAEATHAWFDSRVAHHLPRIAFGFAASIRLCRHPRQRNGFARNALIS